MRVTPYSNSLLALADEDADAARAVEWGRQGLIGGQPFPWYDARTDGLRPIEVREARPATELPPSGLDAALQGLAWTLLVAILAAFGFLLLRQWLRARRSSPPPADAVAPPATAPQFELLPAAVDRGHGDLLSEVRRAAAAGDFGRAVLFLFSYQLLRLDQQQIIRLGRGKTNRQYLREAGARPALPDVLRPTMIAFEDVFFGRQTLARERFEACWAALPRFEKLCTENPS